MSMTLVAIWLVILVTTHASIWHRYGDMALWR